MNEVILLMGNVILPILHFLSVTGLGMLINTARIRGSTVGCTEQEIDNNVVETRLLRN